MLLRNAYYSTAANPKAIVRCVYLTFKRYPMLYSQFPGLLWNRELPVNAFLMGAMAVSTSCFLHTSNLTVTVQGRHGIGEYRTGNRDKYSWSSSIPVLWGKMRAEINSRFDFFLTQFKEPAET
jgi:hypothetical protein